MSEPKKLAKAASRQQLAQRAATKLGHSAALDIYSQPSKHRKVSIVCTIGPKTNSVEMMTKLRRAGMNVVRMNFSHGSYEYHASVIENIRQSVTDDVGNGRIVGIALDTKGPEIRTGILQDGEDVFLGLGHQLKISVDPKDREKCTENLIFVDYKNLPKVMKKGGLIYVDDGLICLSVLSVSKKYLQVEVLNAGMLGSRKGLNLPKVHVDLPALSEKDKKDLMFGVEQGVDMVFASFIRKAADVKAVRKCLGAKGKNIKIISKIENHEGVQKFDEILEVTDGIMVARGDLGIEIPPEKVFLAQKMMSAKCNLAGKPIICATQMLESMTTNPRPTRAEVSDVANAVIDGCDCVMLSGETAKGNYPIEAVTIMSRICQEAESAAFHKMMSRNMMSSVTNATKSESVAMAGVVASNTHHCAAIITLTSTGESARLLSKFRPIAPIVVVTRELQVCRQLHLHLGCYPFHYDGGRLDERQEDLMVRIQYGIDKALEQGFVNVGDIVMVTYGWKSGPEHRSLTDYRIQTVL